MQMTSLSRFFKWNTLPEELKLECIKWLDIKTRCFLRSTSRTERRLVNSRKSYLYQVDVSSNSSKLYNPMDVYIEVSILERKRQTQCIFKRFKREEMVPRAIPLLTFIFGNSHVANFGNLIKRKDETDEKLDFLMKIPNPSIGHFYGTVTRRLLRFFENLTTLGSIEMDYHSSQPFPIEQFLQCPAINRIKKWVITTRKNTNLGQKIGRKWIENDVNVKSVYFFRHPENKKIEDFVEVFADFKIVQKTDRQVRIKTRNPEKHLLLINLKDYGSRKTEWALAMISKDLPEADYGKIRWEY